MNQEKEQILIELLRQEFENNNEYWQHEKRELIIEIAEDLNLAELSNEMKQDNLQIF